MQADAAIDWNRIDTVLVDMDGTLLDLRFDNWFWQEHIPQRYGAANGMTAAAAWAHLKPRFAAARGTIQWYCIDHWTRDLGLDIADLKRAALHQVVYLPGAEAFLNKLKSLRMRRVLVTNAHPATLAIKNQRVGLQAHFDACYSTHSFGVPKEDPAFWPRFAGLETFDVRRTVFIDDSLAVLTAAQRFGIRWLRAIRRPDSGQAPQSTGAFIAVDGVGDLL